jgi:ribosomal protein L35AE/L33A
MFFLCAVSMELFHIYEPERPHLKDYVTQMNTYLAEGKIVPNNVTEYHGFDGAKAGLQKLLDGKTSCEKCVVVLAKNGVNGKP